MSAAIRAGYKQTEVGVIPEDWEVRPLLSAVRIANGQVDPKDEPYKSMILVAPDHIEGKTGRLLDQRTASDQKAISGKYLFSSGDIVYSKIRPYLRKAVLADFSGLCSADMYPLKAMPDVDAGFMLPVLLGERFSGYADSVSARSGMPKINRAELDEYVFALPPLPEQRAIAAALSDVDALLAKLDEFIAKKRDLKQAAMQQLLTGQTRLPGFSGEAKYKPTAVGLIPEDWDVAQLSSVARVPVQNGIFNEPARKGRGCKLINVGDLYSAPPIHTENLEKFDATRGEVSKFGVVHGDLFFTRSSITPDGIAHCNIYAETNQEDIVFDCHIIRVQANTKRVDPFFIAKFCITRPARTYLVANAKTTTMTTVDQAVIGSLPIPIPPLPEQTAIATILSDMDSELSALEARRDKTRALKQGMMQELLTGRIRLV
jgi:type I restriction enzyme S subunit